MRSKFFLLSLVALTLAFTACNKKDDVKSETDATISVAIKSADLRAYEDGAGDADRQVKTLAVMVYEGQAQVAYKAADQASSLEVKDIPTTAGTKTLLVVANFEGTDFQGKSLTEALAMTHELGADDQDPAKGKHMLTSDATTVTLKKGKNYYGYEDGADNRISVGQPMQLKHIHAGMSFTSVAVEFATQYKDLYNVKFDNGAVMALIAKKQSNVFGASLVNNDANYLYGEKHFGKADNKYTPEETKYTLESTLFLPITKNEDIVKTDIKGMGFYVLENNVATHPTILCLKGKLTQHDGTELTAKQAKEAVEAGWIVSESDHSTFYPVLVNWEKDGYSFEGTTTKNGIVRNNKYEISLKITGPGTNSPEDPTQEKANLDVKCVVTPWNIVKQNVTW